MTPGRYVYPLARTLLALIGGVGGLLLGDWLLREDLLTGPNNLLYLTTVGFLLGYLVSGPLARWLLGTVRRLSERASRIPPETVLAGGAGATIALLVAVLLNNVLAPVPGFTWYWSLLIALVLVMAISSFFVANRRLFSLLRPPAERLGAPPVTRDEKIVDTSALIDGRIVDVIEANFLEGVILVPKFVLLEIQKVADSGDPLRRKRGRRGLDVLDRLSRQTRVETRVIADDPEVGEEVDAKLLALCQARGSALITTDYNLERIAAVQGVRVLNVNALANAVRAAFLPGERLSLTIVREGREAGQGLAYLEDGTMVVVEDAAELVGKTVDTVVTSSLQTNMGRMIFARTAEERDIA